MSRDSGNLSSSSGRSGASFGSVGVNGVIADIGSFIEGVAGVGGSSEPTFSRFSSDTNQVCGGRFQGRAWSARARSVPRCDAGCRARRDPATSSSPDCAGYYLPRAYRARAESLVGTGPRACSCRPPKSPLVIVHACRNRACTGAVSISDKQGARAPICAHCAARTSVGRSFCDPCADTRSWKRS
jgi:hypothetical protein